MKKLKPSEEKAQALSDLLSGKGEATNLLTDLVRLSTEKTLQEILECEQQEFLGRKNYGRIEQGSDKIYRNGYEPGHIKTAEGVMQVSLPQVRGVEQPYRSEIWQTLSKSSEQLEAMVVEMYARGLSTRDIEELLESALGQFCFSKSSVSRITEQLHKDYEAFKERDLSGFDLAYLFVDVVYEPLRRYGCRTGVAVCWGITSEGSRVLLDMTLANNESFEAMTEFFHGMIRRGLTPPLSVTSDGAPGIIQAIDATWPRCYRIRCWFHKMQNLQQKVPPELWPEYKALVEDMRDAPDSKAGQARYQSIIQQYQSTLPEACRCLSDDIEASLNHLQVPKKHRIQVRTTNMAERCFVEERRRTKVIPHLWQQKDLTKLVFAVLIRVSQRWATPRYSEVEQRQLKKLWAARFPASVSTTEAVPKTKRRSASLAR